MYGFHALMTAKPGKGDALVGPPPNGTDQRPGFSPWLLVDVLGKDPHTTHVVIDEVELVDWGIGGLPVHDYRASRRQ